MGQQNSQPVRSSNPHAMQPSSASSELQLNTSGSVTITVTLDADLLAKLDRLTEDRDRAIASGIKLWCDRQSGYRLRHAVEAQQRRHDEDETGWLV